MKLKDKLKADVQSLSTTGSSKNLFVLFLAKKNYRVVLIFRILNHYHKRKYFSILLSPLSVYYRLMTNKYCIDLPEATTIGPGFRLNHGYGIVVNKRCIIGSNVYIGHNVTIGSNSPQKFPRIGNNVTIFPGSIIIGDVTIGDNVIVGAGSLVIKSIPPNTIVGAHPCKILKTNTNIDITG